MYDRQAIKKWPGRRKRKNTSRKRRKASRVYSPSWSAIGDGPADIGMGSGFSAGGGITDPLRPLLRCVQPGASAAERRTSLGAGLVPLGPRDGRETRRAGTRNGGLAEERKQGLPTEAQIPSSLPAGLYYGCPRIAAHLPPFRPLRWGQISRYRKRRRAPDAIRDGASRAE